MHDPEMTTREVVERLILPQTQELRCRYCDLLSDKSVGPPSYYLIHAWQTPFVPMGEAVRQVGFKFSKSDL